MLDVLRLLAVYGGGCAVVLWLVHRTLRPVAWPVALILTLLPFAFTGRAMLTGGHYGGLNLAYNTAPLAADQHRLPELDYRNGILMDQVCQVIPWRKAVREAVKTGHWPLRNRYARGGDVLLGLAQPAPFDPSVWLGFLLPLATAVTFACSFVFFQAVAFTWLYLRELDLGDAAALVGGTTFMASHFLAFWVGWSMSSVWAALPLLCFGVHRLAHGRPGGFGATVAASTLVLVGGHPESALHVATVALAVFLWERPWRAGSDAWPRVRRTLLAGLAALALSAPAVLPFLDAMMQTADVRARQISRSHHQGLELGEASRSLVGAFLPWAYGRPFHDAAEEKPAAFDTAARAGVGGAAWVLAVAGLVHAGRRRGLFAGLAVVGLAAAAQFPVLTEALGRLPLFELTLNKRLAAVAAFAVAALAAFGVDAVLGRRLGPAGGRRLAGTLLGATIALVALVVWHLDWHLDWHLVGSSGSGAAGGTAASFVRSVPLVLLPALLVTLLAGRVRWRRAPWTAAVLLALVLGPRTLETPHLYRTFSPDLFFPPLQELEALPDFQADGGEPFRVTAPYLDMIPALGTLWHLEDPRGYATMRHHRQARTLGLWCEPSTAWWFCQVRDLGRPFLSALGVRYLVADPQRRAADDWTLVTRGDHLSLWENPRALPRAFAPDRVLRLDPDADPTGALRRLGNLRDFRRAAVVEFDAWGKPAPPGARNADFRRNPAGSGRAAVSTRAEGPDLVVTVEAPAPTWIVVSETPWRGWRAVTDDGRRLDLAFANVSMLAFRAPAGTSEVRLTFWPASFTAGLTLAALALLALAWVGAARGLRRGFRRRSATRPRSRPTRSRR